VEAGGVDDRAQGRGGDGVTHDELGVAEPEGPGDAGRTGAGW